MSSNKINSLTTSSNISIVKSLKSGADDETSGKGSFLGYTQTLMCGKYTRDLGEYARKEARRRNNKISVDKPWSKELYGKRPTKLYRLLNKLWLNTLGRLGGEWILMVLLGASVAVISYSMDEMITFLHRSRVRLFHMAPENNILQFLAWVSLPVLLVMFGAGFVQIVSPQAVGSGFAEIRCILQGVVIKGYLNFSTLVAKVVGLTAVLGAGIPIGKEGPFVHIASILSQLYGRFMTPIDTLPENDIHNLDLLAAASAVGVGSCFASPVGGVLLSIEATAPYFAVRNYWRGFLGAVCGTLLYRLLFVWGHTTETVTALYQTHFTKEVSFCPKELFVFALFGLLCGVLAALFVWIQKVYILWMKSTKMHAYLQKTRLLYPAIVAFVTVSLQYPYGVGRFTAGEISSHEHFHHLFSNFTWSRADLSDEEAHVVNHWQTPESSAFFHLLIFFAFSFLFSIIGSTMPVPAGMFIPLFKAGAALGRLVGELMHIWFPQGLPYGNGLLAPIVPGGYAVVGAAAFAGGVTHTISICAMVFEITGQVKYMAPVIVAALVANIVSRKIHPSMYDMLAEIKKLPNLPDISSLASGQNTVYAQDFMVRDVLFIWKDISYQELVDILEASKDFRSLPLVDNPKDRILLGSVERIQLLKLIDNHMSRARRQRAAAQRWLEEQANTKRRVSVYELSPDDKEDSESDLMSESASGSNICNNLRRFFRINRETEKFDTELNTGIRTFGKSFVASDRYFDFLPEDRKIWEAEEIAKPIDLHLLQIDPAPVQLIENTPILKVHRMFSMIAIDMAYVTNLGRLVGVVGLNELRKTVVAVNKGTLISGSHPHKHDEETGLLQLNKNSCARIPSLHSYSQQSTLGDQMEHSSLPYIDDSFDTKQGDEDPTLTNIEQIVQES
ncbi:chloride channel protein 2-like [Toxorhynchites rutilus septentrionalis]|uniref:chloride channel protein 2-like n=1 Tax=Toxorhynchites rutilus septentrionalis TaxID=329112 RepID=UPI002478E03A|nr:chloride channel protein 2-like [Toxorhynchites rutilus septentrionalis]